MSIRDESLPVLTTPGWGARGASPVRRALGALRHEREPHIRLHMIAKLYETRPSIILVSAVVSTMIGGAAAVRAGDSVMWAIVAVTCLATLSLLPVVLAFPRTPIALDKAIAWERGLSALFLLVSTGIGLLCARSLEVTSDPFVHILTISLALGTVITLLRNYFRPKLALAQLAVLLAPPGLAEALHPDPFYWIIAAASLGLAYNVFGITLSLYAESLALLLSRQKISDQTMRLDAALDNMAHGLCMFDKDQRLVLCNARYRQMYGFAEESMRPGITLREAIAYSCEVGNHRPEDADAVYRYLIRSTKSGAQETFDHRLADGRVILVSHKGLDDGGWVAVHADITKQRASEAQIEYLAKHDVVTGLANRLLVNEALAGVFKRKSPQARLAVLLIDLDRFKNVNDTLGHPVGDELLRQVARRLEGWIKPSDLLARLGGDEFAIVRTGKLACAESVMQLAETIRAGLQEPFDLAENRFVLGASIGISFRSPETGDPSSLLREADLALYAAKNGGRGQFRTFAPDMDHDVQQRRVLESGLRQALANGEFELLYQPIVDAESKRIICFEALLRWHTSDRGTLTPDEFIPLAEDVGVIRSIGEWALHEACREAATWPATIPVAVNLSPVQFRSSGLAPMVMMALARSGLAPERLELEITESVLLKGTAATLATLNQLKELGVRVALDDFGTGYSSLSYLRTFKFDKVKIDKSFIQTMDQSLEARAVIEAVITLARRLEIECTAEGVETEAQLVQLRRAGCRQAQGYLFGRPARAAELVTLTRAA